VSTPSQGLFEHLLKARKISQNALIVLPVFGFAENLLPFILVICLLPLFFLPALLMGWIFRVSFVL